MQLKIIIPHFCPWLNGMFNINSNVGTITHNLKMFFSLTFRPQMSTLFDFAIAHDNVGRLQHISVISRAIMQYIEVNYAHKKCTIWSREAVF